MLGLALGRQEKGKTKILLVPTMHGSLHNAILTESLQTLDRLGSRNYATPGMITVNTISPGKKRLPWQPVGFSVILS
jgi:hypothetical protein